MGSQSVVYGYIQCDVSADVANVAVLESYPFDEVYPFPRIFSLPRSGYQSSVISFGHVFKDLARDWDQWVSRFEDLLGRLAWTCCRPKITSWNMRATGSAVPGTVC